MEKTKPAELLIRKMTENDLSQVLGIERQCFATPWSEEAFVFELTGRSSLTTLLVAETRRKIDGYIVFWVVGDSGEILDFAVSPRSRRQGIGSMLLRATITQMESSNVSTVHLEIRPSNTAAIALYRKYGFNKSYVRPAYYEKPPEDAWVFVLPLKT